MTLKNYTSEVPAVRSLAEIDALLIQAGVIGITKEFAAMPAGKISAVTFSIPIDNGRTMAIRLPANEEGCLASLWREYVGKDRLSSDGQSIWSNGRKRLKRESFRAQAERVAWRIVKDWVAVQLSMVQMNQADVRQVFLPYAWDGTQTFFERLKSGGFLALDAPKSPAP